MMQLVVANGAIRRAKPKSKSSPPTNQCPIQYYICSLCQFQHIRLVTYWYWKISNSVYPPEFSNILFEKNQLQVHIFIVLQQTVG